MLTTLFELQKELDTRIEKEHGLEQADLMDKKIMALLVELGELANETRCFKFWSKKPAAARDVILEEYVDGVHFILSIGLELKLQDQVTLDPKDEYRDLVEQFQLVFASIIEFRKQLNLENYHNIFNEYIILGKLLGFSSDDIEKAYKLKNEVNHKRQNSGY
ncbi:dUTP diphosphatase [Schinkia azotoformans]|uniref:dUTP diphosphatase n=1 Tax=Schinkia azotoformans TaxID=1454 RepID=UPI002DB9AF69|nr:dUTP diphosphatase [Schinkia azotoformans]MEC1770599.1 dUTP diphosphatase [Schinkia azotoformans]MED4367376.1 dUTP diphosphatase [Schinkia azotoformans]